MGSLREALFLTVWLRRQEMEVTKVKAIVTALHEITVKAGSLKASEEAFKAFVESAFPFSTKSRGATDQKMVEVMKKEAAKGPILFTPQIVNPLTRAAKTMRITDEFRKKLQDKVRARRK